MCSRKEVLVNPSRQICPNFARTSCGDGTKSGLTSPSAVTSHQMKRRTSTEATESQKVLPWPGTP
jgi:hypothetical protein